MELHNVPRETYVRVLPQKVNPKYEKGESEEVRVPPAAAPVLKGELIFFSHIDGMYSLCHKVNEETLEHTGTCHMAAWTEVEIVSLDELFTFEQIREKIGRSGYGKDGTGEYRQAALKDMSDGWVKGAIDFVPNDHPHLKFYKQELEYRKTHNIFIPELD